MKCTTVAMVLSCALMSTGAWPQTPPPSTQSRMLTVRPEPARDPWWQRASWAPRATVVRGMPVKRIEPAWCAAEAFTSELFGEELLQAVGVSPLEGAVFSLESSFDGSGNKQTAFIGAYRRCEGESGLFVAIIDRPGPRPRLRFLVEVPDPGTAFATLALEPDGTLAVWWCPACDKGHRIAFNRETRGFYVAGPATRR
jgi:hypothetical protein